MSHAIRHADRIHGTPSDAPRPAPPSISCSTACATSRITLLTRSFSAVVGVVLSGVVLAAPSVAAAADLTVNVSNISQARGTIQVAVYGSEADFRKTPLRGMREPATVGTVKIVVSDLPAGDYAVMVFQDLDGNDKLDTNLLGMPKEPWGGSLQGKSVFGAPGWSDAVFKLSQAGATIEVGL